MRLLAVDDDDGILELLSQILESFGYSDVVTASSGAEALQILATAETPFDCLLLDVQMPQMNGITLCEEVRMLPDYLNVPIIMLTAMVQERYIDEAFEAGATDYVTKPFDFSDLNQRLSDAQRLAAEREASLAAILEMEAENNSQMLSAGYSLMESLRFDGQSGCVGLEEFENYALQITKSRLLRTSVQAVKLGNIEEIFATSSTENFERIVALIGKAVSDCFEDTGTRVSYRGNGVFLLVRRAKGRKEISSFQQRLALRFSEGRTADMAGINAFFIVGDEVPLKSTTKSDVIQSLNFAIQNVENRNASDKKAVGFS